MCILPTVFTHVLIVHYAFVMSLSFSCYLLSCSYFVAKLRQGKNGLYSQILMDYYMDYINIMQKNTKVIT